MTDAEVYIEKIITGLKIMGRWPDPNAEDLAPVDQFHVRGLDAISELVTTSGVSKGDHVLDIGGGSGGPARILALRTGCRVTGIDLDPVSVEAGNIMSQWTELADRVHLQEGSATDLPFDTREFDAAWSVHVGMFISDKARFYGEAFRILKPGGCLSVYDPCASEGGDYGYPVPWARLPEDDHILTSSALCEELGKAGFESVLEIDRTEEARAWLAARQAAASAKNGPPPLGLHLLVGEDFAKMTANVAQGLLSGAISFTEFHATKPL